MNLFSHFHCTSLMSYICIVWPSCCYQNCLCTKPKRGFIPWLEWRKNYSIQFPLCRSEDDVPGSSQVTFVMEPPILGQQSERKMNFHDQPLILCKYSQEKCQSQPQKKVSLSYYHRHGLLLVSADLNPCYILALSVWTEARQMPLLL